MRAERESAARDLRRSISRSFALHLAVRVIEAAAIGWLAACVVLALVTWTMPAASGLHGALAAGIAGAAAAGALWIERTPRLHDHVRRADRRLGLDGALITARDVSAEAEPASLAGALVERVRARTGRFGLARASLPSTPLALVAVLLGTTLLLASHDDAARHGGNSTDVANIDARAEALASAAAALSTASARLRAADGLESGTARAFDELASDLARVARAREPLRADSLPQPQRLNDALQDARLEDAERTRLAHAADALRTAGSPPAPGGSNAAQGSDRVVPTAASARDALAASGPSGGAPGTDPSKSGASAADSSALSLASSAPDGRMSAPDSEPGAATTSPADSTGAPGAERGVGATRWWPARHDAVVAAWIESLEHQEKP